MPRRALLLLSSVLIPLLFFNGGRRKKLNLSFHIESTMQEGSKLVRPVRLGSPPTVVYFRKSPEISHRQIVGYYPFPAKDGQSYGCAFKLNQAGAIRLQTVTTTATGRRLLTVVNTTPVNFVVIDQPITDGYIVIWAGVTAEQLAVFGEEFQRIQPQAESGALDLRGN